MDEKLTHFDQKTGKAKMVDVGGKAPTRRTAIARGIVKVPPQVAEALALGEVSKGDAFTIAKTAAIMAAKKTGDLIPLCHPLGLDVVNVEMELHKEKGLVTIESTASMTGKTGVEMEAMMAVSIAALTLYDMIKGMDKGSRVLVTGLYQKTGGKSGNYKNPEMEWEELLR
ncbi:MAG: cyclic pyranopterin monophosphate synthase MoaC [SAR324 cluster bacterium]|nr:cyclic pyranopterin monophosphate synthase MoaC [SAR324 cluster bacterium]